MIKVGVPVVPGSDGLLQDVKEGIGIAKDIGYPVTHQGYTAGGGGKG